MSTGTTQLCEPCIGSQRARQCKSDHKRKPCEKEPSAHEKSLFRLTYMTYKLNFVLTHPEGPPVEMQVMLSATAFPSWCLWGHC